MNRFVKIILAIVIVIAIPKIIMKVVKPNPKEKLASFVKEMNAKLPMTVDANTQLDKVDFSNNVYKVSYSLKAPQAEFSEQQKTAIETYAISQVCTGSMKIFADEKVTVEFFYNYDTSSGPQTLSISVPPHKCT